MFWHCLIRTNRTQSFWRTLVLFWGHCYPCFRFLWHLLWVSKPEWILPYSLFLCGGECNVHSPRSTSYTHANLSTAGAQPVTSLHACAEVGLGLDLNGQSPEQKMNTLTLCQRPGLQRWDLAWIWTANHPNRRQTRYHCASDLHPAHTVCSLSDQICFSAKGILHRIKNHGAICWWFCIFLFVTIMQVM